MQKWKIPVDLDSAREEAEDLESRVIIADNEHEGCHREGPIKVNNEEKSLYLVPGYFIGKLHLGLVG